MPKAESPKAKMWQLLINDRTGPLSPVKRQLSNMGGGAPILILYVVHRDLAL